MKREKPFFRIRNVIALLIIITGVGYFAILKIKESLRKKTEYVKNDQSIAVLPFQNISNDSAQDYFSDGITEGILNSLAHLKGLKV